MFSLRFAVVAAGQLTWGVRPHVSTVEIQASDIADARSRQELTRLLPQIARLLQAAEAPVPQVYSGDKTIDVRATVETPGIAQVGPFIEQMLEISRRADARICVQVTLDHFARLRVLSNYPGQVMGDGHLVWVRPTEGQVLHGFFQYLFGPLVA